MAHGKSWRKQSQERSATKATPSAEPVVAVILFHGCGDRPPEIPGLKVGVSKSAWDQAHPDGSVSPSRNASHPH